MSDILAEIIKAWLESPLHQRGFISARVMLRLATGSLRTAIRRTNPDKKLTPSLLGSYLSGQADEGDIRCGHRIRRDYDRHLQSNTYKLEKVSEAELRRIEFEARERNPAKREPRRVIFVVPYQGWFSREADCFKRVEHFRAEHFDAATDYKLSGHRYRVVITGADLAAVKPLATRWMLTAFETEIDTAPERGPESDNGPEMRRESWDSESQTWRPDNLPAGHFALARFDHNTSALRPAIRMRGGFSAWSPFSVGTQQTTNYTPVGDAFDRYRKS